MRESILVRTARALVTVAILSQFAQNRVCHADFLSIYGGPTYSDANGGYLPTKYALRLDPYPQSLVRTVFDQYGAVNDAGVAVGNVDRIDTPLTSTLQNVYGRVATWSATSSSVILDAGSPTDIAEAFAINSSGTAVGVNGSGGNYQRSLNASSFGGSTGIGARWSIPANTFTPLAGSSSYTSAFGINSQGVSVGVSDSSAVRWDSAGGASSLSASGAGVPSAAFAINNGGMSVGYAYLTDSPGGRHAVRWDASGTGTILGTLGVPPFGGSIALAVNSSGTAVGYSAAPIPTSTPGQFISNYRAVRWDPNGTDVTELGNLGTDSFGATNVRAIAINDAGVIIGNADVNSGNLSRRAVRWDPNSTTAIALDLLATPGSGIGLSPVSTASAINTQGIIVGSALSSGQRHAVYWNPDGSIVDMNSLIDPASGWTLVNATAISDTGWILGLGSFNPDGAGGQVAYDRLFLVQVPEPSSLVLLALGIGGMAARVGRRRRW